MEENRKQIIQNIFNDLLIKIEDGGATKRCFITFSCELCNDEHSCTYDTLRLRKFKTYCNPCSKKAAGKTKTTSIQKVIDECNSKYNNYYTYFIDESYYINKKSLIKITCPLHGDFSKSVQKHLSRSTLFPLHYR